MTDSLVLLAPALCLVHLIGAPIMAGLIKDDNRFYNLYTRYTAVIVFSIIAVLSFFMPRDLGFDGAAYLFFPVIPIVFTTPVALSVRAVCRVIRKAQRRP